MMFSLFSNLDSVILVVALIISSNLKCFIFTKFFSIKKTVEVNVVLLCLNLNVPRFKEI